MVIEKVLERSKELALRLVEIQQLKKQQLTLNELNDILEEVMRAEKEIENMMSMLKGNGEEFND